MRFKFSEANAYCRCCSRFQKQKQAKSATERAWAVMIFNASYLKILVLKNHHVLYDLLIGWSFLNAQAVPRSGDRAGTPLSWNSRRLRLCYLCLRSCVVCSFLRC